MHRSEERSRVANTVLPLLPLRLLAHMVGNSPSPTTLQETPLAKVDFGQVLPALRHCPS